MGTLVFVDTSALVAKFLEADERHRRAGGATRGPAPGGREFLTTHNIFDEVVTRVRGKADHPSAVKAGEGIRSSSVIDLVEIDSSLREGAWGLFRKYRDHELSFTD